jgi:hypothetical protein
LAFGEARLAYGFEGIWSDGDDIDFQLMGSPMSTTYGNDELTGRVFARLESDFGSLQGSYDSDQRVAVTASLMFRW